MACRSAIEARLRPAGPTRGLSGYELTRRLRDLFPRDTVLVTDVGSVKMITSQAWSSFEPLTFFESNGLSAMSYSLPAAMAARLQFPDRPVLCTAMGPRPQPRHPRPREPRGDTRLLFDWLLNRSDLAP